MVESGMVAPEGAGIDLAGILPGGFDLAFIALPFLAAGVALLFFRRARARRDMAGTGSALEESQARLRLAVEQMPAVLWSTDDRLRFTSSQGAGLEALGLAPDEVVGLSLYEYFRSDDPGFPAIAAHLQALEGKSSSFESNWMGQHFQSYVEPLRSGSDGRIRGTVGIALNVTEQTRAQSALKLSEEHLRQAQKMEAIGCLASGVAHDFNNLLTTIAGHVDLASRCSPRDGPAARSLDEIRRAAEKASALTRQLLIFSRKQVLDPKVLDLNAVVSEMEGMLARIIGEDVEMIVRLNPEPGLVRADEGQLSQIILNLAVNAREAMPGGGKLLIETALAELGEPYVSRHSGVSPGHYAVLAVSDTGVGMDKATQARLFEPFFTTKGAGEGTGVGLATVYGIVKQSGGNVWVYSEPGQGATIKVYLPLAEGGRRAAVPGPAGGEAAEGSESVLIVEDDDTVRGLLADGLRLSGFTALEAKDGEEALRTVLMLQRPIDLVVTDVVMPRMSGRELMRRLEAARPGTKILFMSGYTEHAIVQHRLLDPGARFLPKPFTPGALARKVREVIGPPRPVGAGTPES